MFLSRLNLVNFKNFSNVEADFCPKINCFVGDNGVGKTNMLDAIYFLSMCKSGLLVPDSQCVKHEEPFFVLDGLYQHNDAEDKIYCGFKQGSGKIIKKNGKEYDKIADHIGVYPLVQISPADNNLVQESGEERRRFMNMVLSQVDRSYLVALQKYNRLLAHRNKLLKSDMTNRSSYEVLEVIDIQMAEVGTYVYRCRKRLIEDLQPVFDGYYAAISESKEVASISYTSHLERDDMKTLLENSFEKDRIVQHTSVGVHRDDLDLQLNGYSAKKMGSQGQQKTLLISLKLAQFELMRQSCGVKPILLLDDIFDKLDPHRVARLIELVGNDQFGQIFITDSNKHRLEEALGMLINEAYLFSVANGVVEKKEILP